MAKFNGDNFTQQELPAEGLWISPAGERINVVEHLETIRNYPERFGLNPITTNDIAELRNIAEGLIRAGWLRFRQLDFTFFFEVNSIGFSRGFILEILSDVSTYPTREKVEISQLSPSGTFAATVAGFRNGQLARTASEELSVLCAWAFHSH
jgi:hypothetical protein